MGKQHKRWCITSFHLDDYESWKKLEDSEKVGYMIYQQELCTSTKKAHIQAYIEVKTKRTMGGIKKILNSLTVHLEPSKGTAAQNQDYCSKSRTKNTKFPVVEFGLPMKQGERNDLEGVYARIKEGATEWDILDEFPSIFIKFIKGINKARGIFIRKHLSHWRKIPVYVFYGVTRSGKTSRVYKLEEPSEVFKLTIKQSGNVWFDGYTGQDVLLIDDFYGQIKVSYLLQLLDGFIQNCEIKGGHVWSNWSKIYITSNSHPREWYSYWTTCPDSIADAIGERITEITEITRQIPRRTNRWVDEKKVVGRSITRQLLATSQEEPKIEKNAAFAPIFNNAAKICPSLQKKKEKAEEKDVDCC